MKKRNFLLVRRLQPQRADEKSAYSPIIDDAFSITLCETSSLIESIARHGSVSSAREIKRLEKQLGVPEHKALLPY